VDNAKPPEFHVFVLNNSFFCFSERFEFSITGKITSDGTSACAHVLRFAAAEGALGCGNTGEIWKAEGLGDAIGG
jgi:hypothetical protein